MCMEVERGREGGEGEGGGGERGVGGCQLH